MSYKHQDALDVLKRRYSCRRFLDKKIEDDVLKEIFEVGLNAAAGGNLQPTSIVMVRNQERRTRIAEICGQGFIAQADTLLVFILDYYRLKRWTEVQKAPFGRQNAFRDFIVALEDVMCMAQSIECAANLLGIGNVYIGTVNAKYQEMQRVLDLPELTVPVLITCLGYPDDQGKGVNKLSRDVVVHEETYHRISDEEVLRHIVEDKYNQWLLPLEGEAKEKYKEHFINVTTQVQGEAYAQEVALAIERQGGVNQAQYRFGWHYNPIRQRSYNDGMYEFLKKQGFGFLDDVTQGCEK